MQNKQEQKRYLTFNSHLKETFGEKVYKVTIDAGFTCPNRDGTLGIGGCIYCYGKRTTQHIVDPTSIKEQIRQGQDAIKKRYKAQKFLAYFQSYTNTYAAPEVLENLYRSALEEEDIVGLTIGTRPDCVDKSVLDIIEHLAQESYLWVEYGLQSIHHKTLKFINRGHGFSEFLDAVIRTKRRKRIKICVHVILGLPGESKEEMLETAKTLSAAAHLHIITDPRSIRRGFHRDGASHPHARWNLAARRPLPAKGRRHIPDHTDAHAIWQGRILLLPPRRGQILGQEGVRVHGPGRQG